MVEPHKVMLHELMKAIMQIIRTEIQTRMIRQWICIKIAQVKNLTIDCYFDLSHKLIVMAECFVPCGVV